MAHILYRNGANRRGTAQDEAQPARPDGFGAEDFCADGARPGEGATFDMGYVGAARGARDPAMGYDDAQDDFAQEAARRGAQGRLHYAPRQHPAVHQSLMEAVRDENPAVRHFIDLQRAAEARAAEIAAELAAAEAAAEIARQEAEARAHGAQSYDAQSYGEADPHERQAYLSEYLAPDESDPRLLAAAQAAKHSAQHAAQRAAQYRAPRAAEAPVGLRAVLGAYLPAGGFRWMMQRTAALASVAMFVGLGVWGYQLAQREKDGLQVISAPGGAAREAPLDPGGELARHTGLSVNSVAAIGTAAPGPDRVTLAPRPLELAEEDAPMADLKPLPLRNAGETAALDQEINQAAADRLFEAALPIADLSGSASLGETPTASAPVEVAEDLTPTDAEDPAAGGAVDAVAEAVAASVALGAAESEAQSLVPTSVPGLKVSPRPIPRPGGDLVAETAAQSVAAALAPEPAEALEIAPESLASGTRLVQIGAHDSAEQARAEWDRVAERFGALMEGKRRVIQEAVSGGRTFYRLRVEGFTDVADSRRFCAALVAERTNCIPAQVR